ncbi:hypothetical protein GTQ75_08455 [Campylobacter coli]|nr:hypothetical protein [Campylobacter coli]
MKKAIKIVALIFTLSLGITTTVNAATAIKYEGYGIRGIQSVKSWNTSSRTRYTVHHNQKPLPGSGSVGFKVSVVNRVWIGAKTYASSIYYGETSGSFSVDLNPGTYGLYFNTTSSGVYDIWGSVTY